MKLVFSLERNPLPKLGLRLEFETLKEFLCETKFFDIIKLCGILANTRAESTAQIGRETWVSDFYRVFIWNQIVLIPLRKLLEMLAD